MTDGARRHTCLQAVLSCMYAHAREPHTLGTQEIRGFHRMTCSRNARGQWAGYASAGARPATMTDPPRLRCYEYVNRPYEQVCAALRADPNGIFRRVTLLSAERANAPGAQLHVQLGALDLASAVQIDVGPIEDTLSAPNGYPITVFPLSWYSKHHPGLFPHMRAKLLVYALSKKETQLELEGSYDPPLGLLGDALDALVGHHSAEASVLQFIQNITARLRSDMQATPRAKS